MGARFLGSLLLGFTLPTCICLADEVRSTSIWIAPKIVDSYIAKAQKGQRFFDFDVNNPPVLGAAVKSIDGSVVNKAVIDISHDAVRTTQIGPYIDYDLTLIKDQNQLIEEMSGSVTVSAKGFLGSGSASTSFTNKKSFDLLHTYVLAKVSIITGIEEIPDPKVVNDYKLRQDYPDEYSFYKKYGDSFVKQRILGGELFILLDISHSSLEEKRRFEATVDVSAWVVSAKGSISSSISSLAVRDKTSLKVAVKGPVKTLPKGDLEGIAQLIADFPGEVLAQKTPAVIRVVVAPYSSEEVSRFPYDLTVKGQGVLADMLRARFMLDLADNLLTTAIGNPPEGQAIAAPGSTDYDNSLSEADLRGLRAVGRAHQSALSKLAMQISENAQVEPRALTDAEGKTPKELEDALEFIGRLQNYTVFEGHIWESDVTFPAGSDNWSVVSGDDDDIDADPGDDETILIVKPSFKWNRAKKKLTLEATAHLVENQGGRTHIASYFTAEQACILEPSYPSSANDEILISKKGAVRTVRQQIRQGKPGMTNPAFTSLVALMDSDQGNDRNVVYVTLKLNLQYWSERKISEYYKDFFDS